jgi:hypothetical protein
MMHDRSGFFASSRGGASAAVINVGEAEALGALTDPDALDEHDAEPAG